MKKMRKVILLIIAVLIIAGITVLLIKKSETRGLTGVPENITDKYNELTEKYSQSLGVSLSMCKKGDRIVYEVAGSGGFSGESFYYDNLGNELGNYFWDDMGVPGEEEQQPPINRLEYTCSILKESKKQGS